MNKIDTKVFSTLKMVCDGIDSVAKVRVSAAIVYKNEIISIGFNQYKTHPFQQKFSKNSNAIYLHAETMAIKNAIKTLTLKELKKSKLYVFRLRMDGSTGCAKPCCGCQRAIDTFEIHNVYYTEDNGKGFISQ